MQNEKCAESLPPVLQERYEDSRRALKRTLSFFAIALAWLAVMITPPLSHIILRHEYLSFPMLIIWAIFISLGMAFMSRWDRLSAAVVVYKGSKGNLQKLEKLIAERRPYGIYLRDFLTEVIPTHVALPAGASHSINEDRVEHSVVKEANEYVPFFALMNLDDIDCEPIAARIYSTGENWFRDLGKYTSQASLVILSADKLSPGVLKEIDWLLELRDELKVFFLTTNTVIKELRHRYPGIEERWCITERQSRIINRPHPVAEMISALEQHRVPRPPRPQKEETPAALLEFVRTLSLRPTLERVVVYEIDHATNELTFKIALLLTAFRFPEWDRSISSITFEYVNTEIISVVKWSFARNIDFPATLRPHHSRCVPKPLAILLKVKVSSPSFLEESIKDLLTCVRLTLKFKNDLEQCTFELKEVMDWKKLSEAVNQIEGEYSHAQTF